jgi:hypothetical protein
MQPKRLTPLEMLQKQKNELQRKSDRLGRTIEKNARYLQDNFGPLLRDNLVESAISKMPTPLQNLTDKLLHKDFSQENKTVTQESPVRKTIQGIAVGISEIVPFFLKGKKGVIISMALKQILKLIRI